ncbi:NADH:ubiquinone reductase (Na(+)-transporting) subunit F [Roseivivax sp. CAU 1761]
MTEVVLGSVVLVSLLSGMAALLAALRQRLMPRVDIDVVVNGSIHLTASRGDALLGILHRGGIMIPAACGGKGTCGLCRVEARGEGAGTPVGPERTLLSAAERRSNIRLACQTHLRGECQVIVPQGAVAAQGGLNGLVVSTRMIAPLIREVVVKLPDTLDYRPGDFMQITAPPFQLQFEELDVAEPFREEWEIAQWLNLRARSATPVTRAYSLANRPEDRGCAVFNIRLAVPPAGHEKVLPPGMVSSWLFSLRPGDAISLSGPFGEFRVQDSQREMIFVGGGVGMAPLRSMIHHEMSSASGRRVRFFYGARSGANLFYTEEFEKLATDNPRFTWTPALSDPEPGDRWTGRCGFIHEILADELEAHSAPEECEFYLCGPPMMISAVLSTLHGLGADSGLIFFDDFGG